MNSCLNLANSISGVLVIAYSNSYIHEEVIQKSLRCHGKNRRNQTEILVLNGTTNTRNYNIIENAQTTKFGNLIKS